jgi:hypothetical protein
LLLGGTLQLVGISATFLVAGFVSAGCVVALTLLSTMMTGIEPVGRSEVLKS